MLTRLSRWKKNVCWGTVIALHLLVLIPSCVSMQIGPSQPNEIKDVRVLEDSAPNIRAITPGNGPACVASYVGIGILVSPWTSEVLSVARGGPADKAGIKAGDIIKTEGFHRFDIGTRVEIVIERGGRDVTLYATIDNVCQD